MLGLISVIVPVYNGEEHLEQCVESILASLYRNIELILVDDGSSDSSPALCDAWAARDSRVKVLHQRNSGPNRARNSALDVASGEFIGFVDDDDWIAPELYSVCMENARDCNADLSITASSYVYGNGTVVSRNISCGRIIMDSEQAFRYINVPGYFGPAPWDKIARAELFDGIRFPERDKGSSFEDYGVAFSLIDRAHTIVYDSTPRYFYRQTSTSLSNGLTEVSTSSSRATRDMVDLVRRKYPQVLPYATLGHMRVSVGVYNSIILSGLRKSQNEYMREVEALVRRGRRSVTAVVALSLARRAQFWMVARVPWLYRFALTAYKISHPRRTE